MAVIKQIFYPYWDWECYLNGMYESQEVDEAKIDLAKNLLENECFFLKQGLEMVSDWPKSAAHHLTNKNINRLAWIGHATCCFSFKITEKLTRIAWGKMTEIDRFKANKIANKIILIYENKNTNLHQFVGKNGLL